MAGSITAMGRDLTQTMNRVNEEYWYNHWHTDTFLHKKLCIKNVTQIPKDEPTSIYADTDSLFVSFKPAIKHCEWKNLFLNDGYLSFLDEEFIVLDHKSKLKVKNHFTSVSEFKEFLKTTDIKSIIIDGHYIKNRDLQKDVEIQELLKDKTILWNWSNELDFIHGIDQFRFGGYFKKCLDEYAAKFGVENKEDFELEKISESIISIAKKKYIQHIIYEDGISHDRLSYLYPKGVELVRSSTPLFARDKIVTIVKYLFSEPENFNIRELLKIVKSLRKEFDLCVPDKIDDISMQSSCSKYEEKVINDKTHLEFVTGAHFAVKASAYYNFLLHKNSKLQEKYEFIKSGSKIKYYYCKDKSLNEIFAFTRGSYPVEMAPEIDLDIQFEKCILSPINSIIEPLGMPEINRRLSVIMDIFGGK